MMSVDLSRHMKPDILHGDAIELLPTLDSNSFQLLLTDPPYNVSRKNNLHTLGRKGIDFGKWDKGFDQTSWLDLAIPLLKPGASIVIWNDWKNLGTIATHLENKGVEVKTVLTWVKSNPFPRNIQRRYVQATEHALWAVKKGKWIFNKDPSKPYETGVFTSPVQQYKHPTKKPDSIFKDLILRLTNSGDWILDPFVGSGTTCAVAKMLGRNYVGIEKSLDYFKLAKVSVQDEK